MLVRRIEAHGPCQGSAVESSAIKRARELGLIAHDARQRWALTPLGWEWCAGRIAAVNLRPGGHRWVATWLRALPL